MCRPSCDISNVDTTNIILVSPSLPVRNILHVHVQQLVPLDLSVALCWRSNPPAKLSSLLCLSHLMEANSALLLLLLLHFYSTVQRAWSHTTPNRVSVRVHTVFQKRPRTPPLWRQRQQVESCGQAVDGGRPRSFTASSSSYTMCCI